MGGIDKNFAGKGRTLDGNIMPPAFTGGGMGAVVGAVEEGDDLGVQDRSNCRRKVKCFVRRLYIMMAISSIVSSNEWALYAGALGSSSS